MFFGVNVVDVSTWHYNNAKTKNSIDTYISEPIPIYPTYYRQTRITDGSFCVYSPIAYVKNLQFFKIFFYLFDIAKKPKAVFSAIKSESCVR